MIHGYAARSAGGKLEAFDYDPGALGHDEVEIDVEFCGICQSDRHMIDNDWGVTNYPLVPGHEVVGTISDVGEHIDHLLVGDVAGLGWHSGYCMKCPSCLSGDNNLCSSAQSTVVAHHGGFADKVRAKAASVVRLPEGISRDVAGPLFCGGIAVFNPLIEFGVRPTDRVGVIGVGGLGHLAIQFCRAWGCEVTAFTSSEAKKDEALGMGAHHSVSSTDPKELEAVAGQFDCIISTATANLDWNAYLWALRAKGRLVQLSAILEPLGIANNLPFGFAQRSLTGSAVGSPLRIATMLEFAVRHDIKPVVETYKMEDVNDALEHLQSGEARYRIVLARE